MYVFDKTIIKKPGWNKYTQSIVDKMFGVEENEMDVGSSNPCAAAGCTCTCNSCITHSMESNNYSSI